MTEEIQDLIDKYGYSLTPKILFEQIPKLAILDEDQSLCCWLAVSHNCSCPALDSNFRRIIK